MKFLGLGFDLARSRRLKAYRQFRSSLERLTEDDLDDMGLKRWQLGSFARKQALKP